MERNSYTHSLKGTPLFARSSKAREGGIVSPLLFNIYMFRLDKYIYEDILLQISENEIQKESNQEKIYNNPKLRKSIVKRSARIRRLPICDLKTKLIKVLRALEFSRFKEPYANRTTQLISPIFVKYANDWVYFITSTIAYAKKLTKKIRTFIKNELSLELDEDKTLIFKLTSGINFLGFEIKMWSKKTRRNFANFAKISG